MRKLWHPVTMFVVIGSRVIGMGVVVPRVVLTQPSLWRHLDQRCSRR
jgi:uncharacterized protein (DUF2062 family)